MCFSAPYWRAAPASASASGGWYRTHARPVGRFPAGRAGESVAARRVAAGHRTGFASGAAPASLAVIVTMAMSGRMRTIVSIALAWLITLPLAAALGMMFFFLTDRIWQ